MWRNPNNEDRNNRLAEKVRLANAVTLELMSEIVAAACARLSSLNKGGKAAMHFARLLESSAWTEASLALVALELPGWTLRRLVYDGDEWHCSLSKQPNLPIEIDDSIDARHATLPLAILAAFLEARDSKISHQVKARSLPQVRPAPAYVVCCDNFA